MTEGAQRRKYSLRRRLLLRRLPLLAIIGVGAYEHPAARIVGHDFVEERFRRAAEFAMRVELGALERMVLEIERDHSGVGRDRVDAFLASRTEQLQRGAIVEFRV